MDNPKLLREAAERFRRLAASINDEQSAHRLEEMVQELERRARRSLKRSQPDPRLGRPDRIV